MCRRNGILSPIYALDIRSAKRHRPDRKSTRLNSSHSQISYAVFCLKKKNKNQTPFLARLGCPWVAPASPFHVPALRFPPASPPPLVRFVHLGRTHGRGIVTIRCQC